MKNLIINQIALRVPEQENIIHNMRSLFGVVNNFDKDNLIMKGESNGSDVKDMPLELAFNFEIIPNFEFELITSSSDFHWHEEIISRTCHPFFLSHLGSYVTRDNLNKIKDEMETLGVRVLQHTISSGHSNPRSDGTVRSYEDIIFDTEQIFGFRLKLSSPSKDDTKAV